jgi:hypothetical protein
MRLGLGDDFAFHASNSFSLLSAPLSIVTAWVMTRLASSIWALRLEQPSARDAEHEVNSSLTGSPATDSFAVVVSERNVPEMFQC